MMRAIRRSLALPAVLVLAVLMPVMADTPLHASAPSPPPKPLSRLDATLRRVVTAQSTASQRVIIKVRPGRRLAIRQRLVSGGNMVLAEHGSLEAITAVVRGQDLAGLTDADDVLSISEDAVVRPSDLVGGQLDTVTGLIDAVGNVLLPGGGDTAGPAVLPSTLRATLGISQSPWTGRGVGVAVVDSGLEMSPEFSGRVIAFYDFTGGKTAAASPFDDYGHGTHVTGTIGGSGALSASASYRGLAPRVRIVALKVLDKNGAGYTSDVIRAIDFAVANKARLGIDLINLSLGHAIAEPATTDPLVQAVERAARAGIIVVAAAGNSGKNATTGQPGYAGITSPGNAPSAITVGAARTDDTVSRNDDRIPSYSSAGPTWYDAYVKPDVVSPGHNIVAVAAKRGFLYQKYPQLKAADPDYMRLSGTSMATAVTTGSIALILEANRATNVGRPPLSPNAVKAVLEYSTVDIHNDLGLPYDNLRKGAGALNTHGAIELGREIDTSTATGAPWLIAAPSPWTAIGDRSLPWSQAVVWGSTVIWGSTTSINETAWGSTVIWGSDTTWSSTVIWGSNIVWTDSSSWADTVIWGSDTIGMDNGSTVIWGSSDGLTASNTAWKNVAGSSTTTTGQ